MPKISRNAPCHCGSGKKYKKCCLVHDADKERASRAVSREAVETSRPRSVVFQVGSDEHLELLSNDVVDMLRAGDIDAAEEACRELKDIFPDQPDGAMRLAEVHKARNEHKEAAEQLMKAVAIMRSHGEDYYDPELIQSLRNEAEGLLG